MTIADALRGDNSGALAGDVEIVEIGPVKDTRNIHQRILAAMEEVKYVQKQQPKKLQYSVVLHDAVTAKVRPALMKQGVHYYSTVESWEQNENRCEVLVKTTFTVAEPGSELPDCLSVLMLGHGCDNQDKGPGKAISYAAKYALLKTLGLETGEDADLESVEHGDENTPSPKDLEADIKQAKRECMSEAKRLGLEVDAMLALVAEQHGKKHDQFTLEDWEAAVVYLMSREAPTPKPVDGIEAERGKAAMAILDAGLSEKELYACYDEAGGLNHDTMSMNGKQLREFVSYIADAVAAKKGKPRGRAKK